MATVDQLGDLLVRDLTGDTAAEQTLATITTLVRSYTRGRGFEDGAPTDDLDAVILTAAARLYGNPEGNRQEMLGAYQVTPALAGWSLTEAAILHRYRQRTA